jgi:hypothetical protein
MSCDMVVVDRRQFSVSIRDRNDDVSRMSSPEIEFVCVSGGEMKS